MQDNSKVRLTADEYEGVKKKILGGGGWITFKNKVGAVNLSYVKQIVEVDPYIVIDGVEFVDKQDLEMADKKGIIELGVENGKNVYHIKKNAIIITKQNGSK